jgi:peptidoglycan/xylan/chitin deacetylase (PgdA/CDA1 family)
MRLLRWCLSILCLACAAAAAAADDLRVAVTFDDLPWARLDAVTPPQLAAQHDALIAALRLAEVRGVAFVNEGKLERSGRVDPERVAMLRDWLDAGWDLGNHTWGHLDLHAVGVDAFGQDVLRGERALRPLLAARDQAPRWFRHPYLRAGRTPQDKAAVTNFLAAHGYRVAPVTVDNSDWIWARAYADALQRDDGITQARLRHGFVPYLLAKFDYFERQSRDLLGYALPQVLLLHANELNAATFVALCDAIRARGYRFVTLDEALADPAYERRDGYTGAYGPSWLHRWAIAEARPHEFFAGEPETPRWVMDLAGVASE